MSTKIKSKTKASDMLFLAALAYLSLLLESVFKGLIVENLYSVITIGDFWWTMILRALCIGAWVLAATGLRRMSVKDCGFDVLDKNEGKPSKLQMILFFSAIAVFLIYCTIDNWESLVHTVKSIISLEKFVYIFTMYIYLAFEALVVVLVIAFAQKGGDLLFGKGKYIPYGGIFLGICWSIVFFFSGLDKLTEYETWQTLILPSLGMLLYGILFGVFHLLSGRKTRFALPFIVITFVLM